MPTRSVFGSDVAAATGSSVADPQPASMTAVNASKDVLLSVVFIFIFLHLYKEKTVCYHIRLNAPFCNSSTSCEGVIQIFSVSPHDHPARLTCSATIAFLVLHSLPTLYNTHLRRYLYAVFTLLTISVFQKMSTRFEKNVLCSYYIKQKHIFCGICQLVSEDAAGIVMLL